MSDIRYFGVGCLIPRISAENVDEWLKKTKKHLEAIPSVHQLSFTGITDINYSWRGGEIGQLGDEKLNIPEAGTLSFKVHIPTRLRTKLGAPLGSDDVEDFYVFTFFSHVHPVTYVSFLDSTGEVRAPAAAVIIVREFLNAELQKTEPKVDLIRIGPTPFHADFFLSPGNGVIDIMDGFSYSRKKQPGYDRIEYFYTREDERSAISADEALASLYLITKQEFSYFYHFESLRNARGRAMAELYMDAARLAERFKKKGIKHYLYRAFALGHRLQSAQLEAISARMLVTWHKRNAKENLDRLYGSTESVGIKEHLEKVSEEDFIEDIEASEKILEIIEGRHSQEVQRFATISFSLLGVIVGAVLTAAFRGWWG
ncbi:hypothetical protein [Streptomyces sp. NPDC006335]|uniref:hypothetical protein n=1 Tax=Streptomyces sp. NPDC006335 TaxID=3156895 RepID=UPI0033A439D4